MSMSHPTVQSPPQAGWYPEPNDPSHQRFWDGAAWTEHVRPTAFVPPMAGPPAFVPTAAPQVGNRLSIAAIILGAIAFLFLPLPLGITGIVLGLLAKRRGESLATWAIIVPLVGMLVGMALGLLIGMAMA